MESPPRLPGGGRGWGCRHRGSGSLEGIGPSSPRVPWTRGGGDVSPAVYVQVVFRGPSSVLPPLTHPRRFFSIPGRGWETGDGWGTSGAGTGAVSGTFMTRVTALLGEAPQLRLLPV